MQITDPNYHMIKYFVHSFHHFKNRLTLITLNRINNISICDELKISYTRFGNFSIYSIEKLRLGRYKYSHRAGWIKI